VSGRDPEPWSWALPSAARTAQLGVWHGQRGRARSRLCAGSKAQGRAGQGRQQGTARGCRRNLLTLPGTSVGSEEAPGVWVRPRSAGGTDGEGFKQEWRGRRTPTGELEVSSGLPRRCLGRCVLCPVFCGVRCTLCCVLGLLHGVEFSA